MQIPTDGRCQPEEHVAVLFYGVSSPESAGNYVHFATLIADKITGKKVAHQERFFVGLAACAKE